jgi:hypothetical protein
MVVLALAGWYLCSTSPRSTSGYSEKYREWVYIVCTALGTTKQRLAMALERRKQRRANDVKTRQGPPHIGIKGSHVHSTLYHKALHSDVNINETEREKYGKDWP